MGPIETTLRKARHLIGLEENWCQGALEIDNSWCSIGAIIKVCNGEVGSVSRDSAIACKYLDGAIHGGGFGAVDYNNTHTHAEVLDLFDKAIKQAEEDGV